MIGRLVERKLAALRYALNKVSNILHPVGNQDAVTDSRW
ncbi:hypothetical protein DFP91_5171 [Pseudorhodoplanes sinuspersici]|nr:hypothetical protein DFP91_5171 [Pseudorhodoplanes sinuspersici]